jgi:S-adenosyl-L-methionine hydrolase (adenosine-forming)
MAGLRPIVFLTDYGIEDEFVGVCHGVIAGRAPEARVIDLTHTIRRQDVASGALALSRAVPYMPADSVYLAVVDPGVGSARLAVGLETGSGAFLVGPDNGLLSLAWKQLGGVRAAHRIESAEILLEPLSTTFHGRDIFAPAAAHLATGGSIGELGEATPPDSLSRLSFPAAHVQRGRIDCVVTWVDGYGNVQLNVRRGMLDEAGLGRGFRVKEHLFPTMRTFDAAAEGQGVAVEDSSGFVALAINRGNAAELLGLSEGDHVVLD